MTATGKDSPDGGKRGRNPMSRLMSLLSAGILSAFEHVMAQFVTLTFFIPLVIATGGNSGIQSATMIIRSISTGEVELSQWFKVLLKESMAGLGIGVLLGLLGFGLGIILGRGPGVFRLR